MSLASSGLLLGVSIGLLLFRVLMEVLPRIEQSVKIAAEPTLAAALALGIDLGVIVFAMLAFGGARISYVSHAVQSERQRIARDLHDGLGFHLMTALSLSRDRTEISADVRMALELAIVELHSVVHFVHSQSVPIVAAMASLRYRLQPVIERKSLQLEWRVEGNIPDDVLVGTPAYHFIKIAQEALSNTLQHAHASRIEVKLAYRRRELLLEVTDNGKGVGAVSTQSAATSTGRGLAGMYERAELIGASLKITEAQGGGTSIRLAVPIPCRSGA